MTRARLAIAGGVAVAIVVASVGGCLWTRRGDERALPADRQAPLVYVALGDSTVEGIGASGPEATYVSALHRRLQAVYPAAQAVNLGRSGATSGDVVAGQLDRAIALQPRLVTVSIGPNDITGRISVDRYEKHLATIFARLAQETSALVVANLLPDLAVTPRFRATPARETVGRLTVAFNEALVRQAREHRVLVVDLYGPSQREVPARPELIAADGYHPSDAGYARWAELVWASLEPRVATP
jgi:acyl-CoA thioesterase-1